MGKRAGSPDDVQQNSPSGNAHATIVEAVRPLTLFAISALLCGCGDTKAQQHAASADEMAAAPQVDRPGSAAWPLGATGEGASGDEAPSAAIAVPNGLGSSAVGALDRPAALRHLFEALAKIDGGQSHEDVTLVQFGD